MPEKPVLTGFFVFCGVLNADSLPLKNCVFDRIKAITRTDAFDCSK